MPVASPGGYRSVWPVAGLLALGLIAFAVVCQAEPPAASPLPENASLLSAIAKVVGALLVVVGLMLVLLYAIKRLGLGQGRGGGGTAIAVLETRMLAPRKYISIVRVADRCLALGVTEQTISLLADLGEEGKAAFANQRTSPPASGFAALLQKSMQSWRVAPPGADRQPGASPQDRQEEP